MSDMWPALRAVLNFYSRIPVAGVDASVALARCVWVLPLAAVVIAWPAAASGLIAGALGLGPLAAALIATMALIITTGALHEDGLADCADGFWGGALASRRLEIMRDSRIGTYGVLALVGAVGLKAALLAELSASAGWTVWLVFLAAAVAGRTVALFPWVGLPNARAGGIAAAAGRPTPAEFRRAVLIAVAVTAVLSVWVSPVGFVLAGVGAALAAKGVASLADAKIAGHTGDVIGAAVVLADLSYLAVFTMCLA